MILPVTVARTKRQPMELTQAVQELLDGLTPTQRSSHSVEVAMRLALDPRRSDHLVRGSALLPHGTGKRVRVVVFAKGAAAEEAREAGADIIGDEELISAIVSSGGEAIAFDRLIATPDFMKPLARAGKVLGPKGLMPNPKMGTLTNDVARAVAEMRRGRLDFRIGRDACMRASVGRAAMPPQQLVANIGALVAALIEAKPKAIGGQAGAAAGAAAAAPAAAAEGASVAEAALPPPDALDGYVRTFQIKTTYSEPLPVSFESLVASIAAYRAALGTDTATTGAGAKATTGAEQEGK
ncbi:hypothetical protein HYH03_000387 [Edaphochlamys debaryana]|uniref:CL1 n=1 Tax=Edaphochlamys debaryana TaxID=47281 RepID=A0A835YQA4_9CHLO|nr:hypothetical protein HYH03_000387 [Edaphochlamys debaryana]|eukprot:KAG2501889.1 hypothetical protein HYH03_000387 [Edaphochlamys debaryana]